MAGDSEIRRHEIGRVDVADRWDRRFFGLMGKRDLEHVALLFPRCSSIHTCFMMGPIDVIFLDGRSRVTRAQSALGPWRLAVGPRGSQSVLELPAGFIQHLGIGLGDEISWSN